MHVVRLCFNYGLKRVWLTFVSKQEGVQTFNFYREVSLQDEKPLLILPWLLLPINEEIIGSTSFTKVGDREQIQTNE